MKVVPDLSLTYNEKHQGYFIFDADYWYDEICKQQVKQDGKESLKMEPLTDNQKLVLLKFLLNDVCTGYSQQGKEIVYDIEEHHYDANFDEPFILKADTNIVSQYNTTYTRHHFRASFKSKIDFTTYVDNTLCSAHWNLFPVGEQEEWNKLGDHFEDFIGKVCIKRKWNPTNHDLLYEMLKRINCGNNLDRPALLFYSL